MRWLINGFLFIIFSAVTVYFVMMRYPEYFDWCVLVSGVIIALYIFMATFNDTRQITLWQVQPGVTKEILETQINNAGQIQSPITDTKKTPDVQRNHTSDARINEIAARIIELMERGKMYREAELSLQDLAAKLKIPSYPVSQAINDTLKRNFYDLVNSYRVEEAKRLLLDPKSINYTILPVGFEAGFNSKTTFNTVFKKFTGLTPTDFRERQKQTVLTA